MLEQHVFQAVERVIGDVQSQHLPLEGELRALVPFVQVGDGLFVETSLVAAITEVPEKVELAVFLVLLEFDDRVDGILVDGHQRPPGVAQFVEPAGLDQRLDHPLVAHQQGRLVEEVLEVLGLAHPGPFRGPRGDHLVADVADGPQPETDVLADRGEGDLGGVDVGRQDVDPHAPALRQVTGGLVLVVADRLQQRRHVLGRVVRLQVGSPVGDHPVGGRVGLVEGVVRERQQNVPEHVDGFLVEPPLLHALAETLVVGVQLRLLLLAHGAAEHVGGTQRVPGELLGDRHHLLLVDDQAVGLPQDRFEGFGELRVDRFHLLAPGLAARVLVVRVGAHGAGTVERTDGGDVLEAVGLHGTQELPHRATVELEDPQGVAALQQVVGGGIGQRKILQHDVDVAVEFDVVHRVGDHREVPQPQEVHLDQPEGFASRVVELGDDGAVGFPFHHRDDVLQGGVRHDHPGGVHTPLAFQAFDSLGRLDHGLDVRVRVVEIAELLALGVAFVFRVEQLRQRNPLAHDIGGHGFGDPLPDGERHVQHPGCVLDGGLRLDGAVGDDLGHLVGAVLVGDVLDHLAATAIIEVDVEVRHGDAFGVEEPLEQQAVFEGVEVGDAHGVGAHGSGARSASGTHADAVVLGPVDEVRDHQEVACESHLGDDSGFELGAFDDLVGNAVGVALVEAFLHLLVEPGVLGFAVGAVEAGHVGADALVEDGFDAFRDGEGVVAGLGDVLEQGPHLLGALEVVAGTVKPEPVGLGLAGARRDAQQGVVGIGVLGVHVVEVVGGHQGQVQVLGDAEQVASHLVLDRQAVVHQLDVEIALPEDVAELRRRGPGVVVLAEPEEGLDLTRGAARGGDQPLAIFVQKLPVGAGLVEEPLQGAPGAELEQVVHGLLVGGPHRHVGVGALR